MSDRDRRGDPTEDGSAEPFGRSLGRAIKVRRAELDLSRRDLAEAAGLSYSYLAEIENGSKQPSSKALSSIAHALRLSPAELMASAEHLAERIEETTLSTGDLVQEMREPHPSYVRGPSLPREGARAVQQRWFSRGRPSLREAAPTPEVGSVEPRRGRVGEEDVEAVAEKIRVYLENMTPDDRRMLLDLARKLARTRRA
jgi:transcriptional regulator with XRE-family HTH domain